MIEQAIVELLNADSTVSDLVDGRIAPSRLDRLPELPMVTYQRVTTPRDVDHGGPHGYVEYRVQVNCWTDREGNPSGSHGQARDLADAVRGALNGYRGTAAGVEVGLMRVSGDRDDPDEERKLDRVSMDVTGNYQEATS